MSGSFIRTLSIREENIQGILRLGSDIRNAELWCLSRDPEPKKFERLRALHWSKGIDAILTVVRKQGVKLLDPRAKREREWIFLRYI